MFKYSYTMYLNKYTKRSVYKKKMNNIYVYIKHINIYGILRLG